MRISDWSSDVCSSDLQNRLEAAPASRSPTTTKQKRGTRERVRRVTCRPPSIPNLQHLLLRDTRSEEHTSELQSLMRISYAVFCLKKKKTKKTHNNNSERKLARMIQTKYNINTQN